MKKAARSRIELMRMDFDRKIGEVIRDLRLKKGLTLDQAADQYGCPVDQWVKFENGKIRSIRVFLEIAFSIDYSLIHMVGLLKKKFPHYPPPPEKRRENIRFERDMNLQEIEFYLQKEDRPWVKEKLQALAWFAEGRKNIEIRKRLGRSGGLIQHWLWRYYKSGIGWVLKSAKVAPPPVPSEVWKR